MTLTKLSQDFRIGFLVHDVSRMRRTLFDQAMKPLGITRSQWWVLSQLSRHTRAGMLQTELARDLDVGKVTVGGLIDRLEASGYVVRQPDATDRRAKRIQITDQGRAVLKQMVSVGRELNQIILAGLSPADIEIAEQILSAMKDNIRRGIVDRGEAELAVGVFETAEEISEPPRLVTGTRR
jgi:DNA-binding MarR family transcriptional regulator